jgi:RNA polymerase sigma-70 factor (ECF subfamily)
MNRLRDEMRRRSRHARPIDDEPLRSVPDQRARGVTAADVEIHERLRMALETLSEGDREIIEMRHTGGMSFKALSDYFDEPLGTLLARHHRALRKLRTALEKLGVDGLDADGGGRHASGGAS